MSREDPNFYRDVVRDRAFDILEPITWMESAFTGSRDSKRRGRDRARTITHHIRLLGYLPRKRPPPMLMNVQIGLSASAGPKEAPPGKRKSTRGGWRPTTSSLRPEVKAKTRESRDKNKKINTAAWVGIKESILWVHRNQFVPAEIKASREEHAAFLIERAKRIPLDRVSWPVREVLSQVITTGRMEDAWEYAERVRSTDFLDSQGHWLWSKTWGEENADRMAVWRAFEKLREPCLVTTQQHSEPEAKKRAVTLRSADAIRSSLSCPGPNSLGNASGTGNQGVILRPRTGALLAFEGGSSSSSSPMDVDSSRELDRGFEKVDDDAAESSGESSSSASSDPEEQ